MASITVTIIPGGFGLVSRDSASLSLISYLTLNGIKHTVKTSEVLGLCFLKEEWIHCFDKKHFLSFFLSLHSL